ncbi:MAG: nitroreductase/quinone reductase family protein [Acidimicrobiia bacterium]|nr:MAG: nitroreductase/quinone reductase family protein [Acidimicrobiia bacterium]
MGELGGGGSVCIAGKPASTVWATVVAYRDHVRSPQLKDATVKRLSALHTGLYRATRGRVGRRLVHNDMLLLTTVGRRTGAAHTVPLLYLRDGDRLIVIASYGGRPEHPEWYRNLVTNPEATVQVLGDTKHVRAQTMTAEERAVWWPKIVQAHGDYAVYQSRTDREIPVVRLD